METKPTIGVVIPAYNSARFIVETLESVRSQSRQPDQVVVVDDGSSDDTSRVVRDWALQTGFELEILRQENAGVAAARNAGTGRLRTGFVLQLDSDDLLLPEAMAALAGAAERRPELVLVFGDTEKTSGDVILTPGFLERAGICKLPFEEAENGLRLLRASLLPVLIKSAPISLAGSIYSKAAWERVGGFDDDLRTAEDYEFFVRLVQAGPAGYFTAVFNRWRVRPDSLTHSPSNQTKRSVNRAKANMKLAREAQSLGFNGDEARLLAAQAQMSIRGAYYHCSREGLGELLRVWRLVRSQSTIAVRPGFRDILRGAFFSARGPESTSTGGTPAGGLKVLTVTVSYPNPKEPEYSPFVQRRMREVAEFAEVRVIAPVPLVDWSNPKRWPFEHLSTARRRQDGAIQVMHPKWLYPPLGTPLNILFLFGRLAWPVARLRRGYRFDLIDSHFGYPDGVVAVLLARFSGCRSMVTLRGNELVNARYRFRRVCLGWALRNSDRIVAVSEELRQLAIRLGAGPSRVRTIHNGVDERRFYPRDRALARQRLGLDADARVVLTAGGLIEAKGHHLVIQALKELAGRGIDADLVIAGAESRDGRFEREIRQCVEDLSMRNRVRFLGHVEPDRLADAMSACDVFCLASRTEGCPNVLLEAMACGAPPVATRVGAVPDLIPSPEYGIVVPVGDRRKLEEGLERALTTGWDRDAIAAYARSRTWRQVAREVVAVMEELFPGRAGASRPEGRPS